LPPILKLIDSHHLRSVNHCARVFLPGPRAAVAPNTDAAARCGKVLSAAKRTDEPLAELRASTPPWHFIRHDIAIAVSMEYARNRCRRQRLSQPGDGKSSLCKLLAR
jgi:hypothetical protein